MKAKLIKRNPTDVGQDTQSQSSSSSRDVAAPTGIAAIRADVKARQAPSAAAQRQRAAREQFAAIFAS